MYSTRKISQQPLLLLCTLVLFSNLNAFSMAFIHPQSHTHTTRTRTNLAFLQNHKQFKQQQRLLQQQQQNQHDQHLHQSRSHVARQMVHLEEHEKTQIRFLGKGERALVRPGVVLVAPVHEYSHWLMKSVVFIHAIGVDEYGEHVTRGVIIDHPTAFTMGEMGNVYGTLAHNLLFRGGDAGNDSAILLHSYGEENEAFDDSGTMIQVSCGDEIGTSGVFEGGINNAMELADDGMVDPERFKFFFNYVQFSDKELENILNETDSDGDAWCSMEVPSSFVLNNFFDRGDAWSYLRNQIKQLSPNN